MWNRMVRNITTRKLTKVAYVLLRRVMQKGYCSIYTSEFQDRAKELKDSFGEYVTESFGIVLADLP